MKKVIVLTAALMLIMSAMTSAQVSSFPYAYGWTSSSAISGDGNWSTTKSGSGNLWERSATGGNLTGPECASMVGFKGANDSRLTLAASFAGKVLSGTEEFAFYITRNSAGNLDATITVQYSTNGGTSWTTFATGGTFNIRTAVATAGTYVLRSYSIPTALSSNANARFSILVVPTTAGSGSDKTDDLRVDDVTIEGGALPIQLASFSARTITENAVELNWNTVSEVNNYGFFVERRSVNDASFVEIPNSFIAGNGTTNIPQNYSYVDYGVPAGDWFYRLRQQDLDGSLHYSEPIQASVLTSVSETAPVQFALLQNYPNPFNPSTEIKFSVELTGRTTLKVFNMIGQEVATLYDDVAEAGKFYSVRLNGLHMASGTYFYSLHSGNKSELRKMMLVK